MSWWRHRPAPENPEPPSGIVLHYRGRAIPCTPLRDPDMDEPGCAAWLAVPAEQVRLRYGEEFSLTVPPDCLPDNCVVLPGFTVPDEEGSWPGSR
jgi:hypothetical protein